MLSNGQTELDFGITNETLTLILTEKLAKRNVSRRNW